MQKASIKLDTSSRWDAISSLFGLYEQQRSQIIFQILILYSEKSSIKNEGIRVILNLFIFFLQEDFARTKSTKSTKNTKSIKSSKSTKGRQANKNKKDGIFMRIKTSKRKKIPCLTFVLFVLFMLSVFFVFFVFFVLFVRLKSSCKKKKINKEV